MNYRIELLANGNETTVWEYPEPACGDFAECHTEPATCDCCPVVRKCDYCTTEVLESELTELEDGDFICTDCLDEKRISDYDWKVYSRSQCN